MLSRTHSTLIDHIHILGVGLTKQFRKKTTKNAIRFLPLIRELTFLNTDFTKFQNLLIHQDFVLVDHCI